MIHLKQVKKFYGQGEDRLCVLRGVDLKIAAGEFVAIMGQSGSGKSTLINIIGFLDRRYEGHFTFDGTDASTLSRTAFTAFRNQHIGWVFQSFKLIANMTVADNVGLPLIYAGAKRHEIKARILEVLAEVGLSGHEHKLPTQLSGGQQQRVAIARALITKPKLLLADEPTGALDSQTSLEILTLFDRLHTQGTTIVMVTHDASVGARAQRIVHFKDGSVTKEVTDAD
jgi:putative ABC transport system ATP-binding protein